MARVTLESIAMWFTGYRLPVIAPGIIRLPPVTVAQVPSPAMQRAILEGMNAETRAEIERRATDGSSLYDALRMTLLHNMKLASVIQPGEPPLSDVVAIDFVRATVVLRQGDRLRAVNFDRQTLRFRP